MTTRDPGEPPKKRGPNPERLKLEGDWEERVREALERPPPPKETTKKGRDT